MNSLAQPPPAETPTRCGHTRRTRAGFVFLLCVCVLTVSMIGAVGAGDAHLTVRQVTAALRQGPDSAQPDAQIVWLIRLPRIVMAALIGASLASAGVAFQSLLRNDLADPYLIGASAGASVGSEALLLLSSESLWAGWAVPAAAFASAVAAMTVVYSLARRGGRVIVASLLLGGVVISAFLGGISTLLMELGSPDNAQRIQYRLNGSLQDATFAQCGIVLVFLIAGFAVLLLEARSMNLILLGEESAQQLGIDVERLKTTLILTGSLLTAATVAFGGIIGFVGLIVPHVARRVLGTPDHQVVLPISAGLGATLMVWADTAARTILPNNQELPVGLVTAFIGAPFFCYLLRRQSRFA